MRSRPRVRALLAGALVLGVGGAMTVAAWTDSESAVGSFAASTFAIEGSRDGQAFASHPQDSPAALNFSVTPGGMSRGSTSYSLFVVRTTAASTVGGTVRLDVASVTGTGLDAYLRYGVRRIPAGVACTQASFAASTDTVIENQALTAGTELTQRLSSGGASPLALCFAVSMPENTSNAAQGLQTTVTWRVTATSES